MRREEIQEFVDMNCVRSKYAREHWVRLWSRYRSWAESSGRELMTRPGFNAHLKVLGFKFSGAFVVGLELKDVLPGR
jgi:hypothetical protein